MRVPLVTSRLDKGCPISMSVLDTILSTKLPYIWATVPSRSPRIMSPSALGSRGSTTFLRHDQGHLLGLEPDCRLLGGHSQGLVLRSGSVPSTGCHAIVSLPQAY